MNIPQLYKQFPTQLDCIKHLETVRWNGVPTCPYCNSTKQTPLPKENRYHCNNCNTSFSVTVGTIFHKTRIDLQKWFLAIWIVTSHKKGISSLQLSRDLDITQKSAWFMLQRIRKCFGIENDNKLNNEVEVDETFIGGKEKNKHSNKKSENLPSGDKSIVMGLVEREGKLNAKCVQNVSSHALNTHILKNVSKDAKLYTDEHPSYKIMKRIYDHQVVKHSTHQYVNGRVHTNTIEGFWSLLKRGIFGIYHFTSKKHLQMYVDEFVFRYNTRTITASNRFDLMLGNMENRLTYKMLIG